MTLCMAAVCYDPKTTQHRIVFASDRHAETGWAGGNVSFKFAWAAKNWPVLIAGSYSQAQDLLVTCRAELGDDEARLTRDNIIDKVNSVSSTFKKKLSERYVLQQLGIDFERFLTNGEAEIPPDVRARVFHELTQLEFGCELLLFGFTIRENMLGNVVRTPHIIEIDKYGEVIAHQNFAAIGTGKIIANSTLYQREQFAYSSLEDTLYHLYEASQLTVSAKAPGVGPISEFLVLESPKGENDFGRLTMSTRKLLEDMAGIFREVGPKDVPPIEKFDAKQLREVPIFRKKAKRKVAKSTVKPSSKKKSAQPSNPETSDGQP